MAAINLSCIAIGVLGGALGIVVALVAFAGNALEPGAA